MPTSTAAHRRRAARPNPLAGALVALAIGLFVWGCGAARTSTSGSHPLATSSPDSPLSVAELVRARHAALAFAATYIASVQSPNAFVVRGASAALAEQLRRNAARFSNVRPGPSLHLSALALTPRSARAIEATMTLAAGGEPGFPIGFALRHAGGRWLATRLDGN